MNTVFAGHLDTTVTVKDLLRSIAQLKPRGVASLQLASGNNQIAGRIFLLGGNRIIGACLTDSFVSGYPALKELMSIKTGRYALVSEEPSDGENVNRSIDMESTALIEQMDNFAELPGPPVKQESLMRKILSSSDRIRALSMDSQSGEWSVVAGSESTILADRAADRTRGGLHLNPDLANSDALVGAPISGIVKAPTQAVERLPVSRQVRALPSWGINLRYASLVAVVAISLAVILGWKALGPGVAWLSEKNLLPFLPARSSSVSFTGTGSGARGKKVERSAHARQRKRN
jgi:hypothetical protein